MDIDQIEPLETEYAKSLLPSSRHPLLELSPIKGDVYIELLWQIKSTTSPDLIFLTSNYLQNENEIMIVAFYKAES